MTKFLAITFTFLEGLRYVMLMSLRNCEDRVIGIVCVFELI